MHDLATTRPVGLLPAYGFPVQNVAFDHAGQVVATGDTARRLRAWHRGTPFFERQLQSTYPKARNSERVRAIGFSPDGHRMYVAAGDELRSFDLLSREGVWSFQPRRFMAFITVSPMNVAVSPEGHIVTSTDGGHVHAFTPEGRPISVWWDNDAPRYLSFLADGTSIIGADGFTVNVWEAYSGRKLRATRLKERVFGMAVAARVNLAAMRTLHEVRILSAGTLETLASLQTPAGVPALAFSPDGERLALAGREEVIVVAPASGEGVRLAADGARVLALAFHPDGRTLAAGCSDGQVRFWDVRGVRLSGVEEACPAQGEAAG